MSSVENCAKGQANSLPLFTVLFLVGRKCSRPAVGHLGSSLGS